MAGRATAWALFVSTAMACGGRSVDVERDDGGGGSGVNGGTDSRGGNSTGGNSTGGSSIGGSSIGGSSTGGSAAGGTSARGGSAAGGITETECGPWPPLGETSSGLVVPDCSGWIDTASLYEVGVRGQWYAFGDQYPGPYDERCLVPGMHAPEECSIVWSPPPPPAIGFRQVVRGEMCTTGEVATVLPCAPTLMTAGCPEADYWTMMGAGIGVDFNAEGESRDSPRHPWDPAAHGVIGFSFELDVIPPVGFRVEVPMVLTDEEAAAAVPPLPPGATTEDHPDGSPYWGADNRYPNSPVTPGTNRVLFAYVRPPRTNYEFEPRRMLGIQFHVPTSPRIPKSTYGFCIKNLTLLFE